jgi:enoyl-CoA hydratase
VRGPGGGLHGAPGRPGRAGRRPDHGRAFSAGVDLRALVDGGGEHARAFVAALARCFEDVLRCPLPVVAAVDGHAIAGGCVLACAADHRVVVDSTSARLGLTELAVGVPFPTSALEIMRWRLGDPLLGRRVLLADTVPGAEAVGARLADELASAEQLLDRALAVARSLAAVPSASYAVTKMQLQAEVRERIDARRGEWEPHVRELWGSEAVLAEIAEFVQRTLAR